MADLKITNAVVNDIVALQKKAAATVARKTESVQQTDADRAGEAVRVDVNPRTEKLADASPPTELKQGEPIIAEQDARQLAADVGQGLKSVNVSFASDSEKTILGLFG